MATMKQHSLTHQHAPWAPHYCQERDCEGGKLMRDLEELTPSGSEYVGDVRACIEFIKRNRKMEENWRHSLVEKMRAREA